MGSRVNVCPLNTAKAICITTEKATKEAVLKKAVIRSGEERFRVYLRTGLIFKQVPLVLNT